VADVNHTHAKDDAHGHDAHGSHGWGRYGWSFLALFVCTVLTYVCHLMPLGDAAFPIAMIIAVTKALVVVLFFMHLYDHPGANRLVLTVSILFLGVAIAMVYADTLTRFMPVTRPHL
jgi:cytochrome c oxidase subunit 4